MEITVFVKTDRGVMESANFATPSEGIAFANASVRRSDTKKVEVCDFYLGGGVIWSWRAVERVRQ